MHVTGPAGCHKVESPEAYLAGLEKVAAVARQLVDAAVDLDAVDDCEQVLALVRAGHYACRLDQLLALTNALVALGDPAAGRPVDTIVSALVDADLLLAQLVRDALKVALYGGGGGGCWTPDEVRRLEVNLLRPLLKALHAAGAVQ